MSIQEILTKHARPATVHSAEPVKQRLLADLRAQKRFNSVVYGCLFGAICLVLLIAVVAVTTDLFHGQSSRTTILAAAGVTVPVTLEWMRRLVREWSQLNLLITLVAHDSESGIQALIQKLLSGLAVGAGSSS